MNKSAYIKQKNIHMDKSLLYLNCWCLCSPIIISEATCITYADIKIKLTFHHSYTFI